MIRTRHPGNMHQWSGSNQNSMQALQMLQKQHSHRMVRQQIRQSFQNHNRGMTTDGGQGMFSGGMHSMNQSQGKCGGGINGIIMRYNNGDTFISVSCTHTKYLKFWIGCGSCAFCKKSWYVFVLADIIICALIFFSLSFIG